MINDNLASRIKTARSGKFVIKIKASNLIYLQIIYILSMLFLRDVIGLPSFILYLTDIINILSIVYSFGRIQKAVIKSKAKFQFYIIIAILAFMCFGALMNSVSPLLFLWGIRNNVRFFAFWLACVVLLKEGELSSIIKVLKGFFWVNVALVTFQYFISGYSGDYLGGIFGTSKGCNGYSNVFLCAIVSLVLCEFCDSKINILRLCLYLVGSLLIATLAELKIFYVEFILAVILVILFKRFSIKSLILIICGIFGVFIGLQLLARYQPDSLKFFFDSDAIEFYLAGNGYTNSGDLNRFTAIWQINEMFFNNNFFNKLFGFGLGSCDMSSYFTSDFYLKYQHLNYRWFTHAWVYLEQGIVGLSLLIIFFISIVFYSNKYRKRVKGDNYILATEIFAILTIIGIIYNSALEIEVCYLIAFMCSIPFVSVKGK